MRPTTATLVLAAGGSRRMGATHKLLVEVRRRPIVWHAARAALDAALGPVLVVTGHRADEVEAALPDGVGTVHAADWNEGLSASLARGVAAAPADTELLLVALGDMPLVSAGHHVAVARAWRPGRIVVPTHDGRPGHPVAFSSEYFGKLGAVRGDRGARGVVRAHPEATVEIDLGDPAVVTDVDDPEALARVREAAERSAASSHDLGP